MKGRICPRWIEISFQRDRSDSLAAKIFFSGHRCRGFIGLDKRNDERFASGSSFLERGPEAWRQVDQERTEKREEEKRGEGCVCVKEK